MSSFLSDDSEEPGPEFPLPERRAPVKALKDNGVVTLYNEERIEEAGEWYQSDTAISLEEAV